MGTGRSAFWYIYHRKDRCDRYVAGGWFPYDRNDYCWVATIAEIELKSKIAERRIGEDPRYALSRHLFTEMPEFALDC